MQLDKLCAVAKAVLQQAIELVEKNMSSDEQLTFQSTYIPGSTIGKHLRHAREHYTLLFESMESAPRILSYDVRKRDTPMESSRRAAVDALQECVSHVDALCANPDVHIDQAITLNAVTPFPQVLKTSFGREFWFTSLHAVHHWSMVRVIAAEQGITVEDSFGVAPSTLVYRGTEAPLGKSKI